MLVALTWTVLPAFAALPLLLALPGLSQLQLGATAARDRPQHSSGNHRNCHRFVVRTARSVGKKVRYKHWKQHCRPEDRDHRSEDVKDGKGMNHAGPTRREAAFYAVRSR